MFIKVLHVKNLTLDFFLLGRLLVSMQGWFEQKVGAFSGESGVGFGQTTGEVLGKCVGMALGAICIEESGGLGRDLGSYG
jgi:hypothetical protein